MHHDKDPTGWNYEVWILAIAMAVLGGLVRILQRLPCDRKKPFTAAELAIEIFISGAVGLGAFMLAQAAGMPIGACAAAGGVGGHMSTRLLFLVENMLENRIKSTEGSK